jgi:dTDP-4-dehydrorhamnose reductase
MLALAVQQRPIRVVADQWGAPTASAVISAALVAIAQRAVASKACAADFGWGTYHFTCRGETTWHGFAEHIFDCQQAMLGWRPRLEAITTAEFPTAARRPANSRLDSSRIAEVFGITAPPWQDAVAAVVRAILVSGHTEAGRPAERP